MYGSTAFRAGLRRGSLWQSVGRSQLSLSTFCEHTIATKSQPCTALSYSSTSLRRSELRGKISLSQPSPLSCEATIHPTAFLTQRKADRRYSSTNHHCDGEDTLCSVCQKLDLDAIFEHGIQESKSFARDGGSLKGHEYALRPPSADVERIWEEDQNTNTFSSLGRRDLNRMIEMKRPAIDIGFLDEILSKAAECAFCDLLYVLTLLSYPSLYEDTGSNVQLADTTPRLRCFLLTFSANELEDFRRNDFEPSATYLEIQLRRIDGKRLPRERHLLQDAKDAKSGDSKLSQTFAGYSKSQKPMYNARCLKEGQADIEIIKSWISHCENSHTYPNCSYASRASTDGTTPPRVINVHNRTIVQTPPACRYIALSYVWGKPHMKSQESGPSVVLDDPHLFPKHLPEALPRTIEDAITLVEQLGESFLWVDGFCIDQDSATDKAAQVGIMDRIYGNALVTVIAAEGSDADAGLPGIQPNSRDPQAQIWAEIKGRRIFVSLPLLRQELTEGRWMTRGWTYQEGLLSPRCLIFTNSQVFWKCSAELLSESISEAEPSQRCWTKPSNYSETFSSPLIHLGDDHRDEAGKFKSSTAGPMVHHEYATHVETYSSRELSFESDSLPAFQGLANALETRFKTKIFWGLPEAAFDLALLWRTRSKQTQNQDDNARASRSELPTWSWASWSGGVEYTREISPAWYTLETHGKPLHDYWKGTVDRKLSRIAQDIEDIEEKATETEIKIIDNAGYNETSMDVLRSDDKNRPQEFQVHTRFLHFMTDSAKFTLFPTPYPNRFCIHPVRDAEMSSEDWVEPDVGESVWFDDPYNRRIAVDSKEWECILMSSWDESDALGQGMPEYDRYKEPVHNVLLIEWKDDVAYRVGMGHIKVSVWNQADTVMKRIKLG